MMKGGQLLRVVRRVTLNFPYLFGFIRIKPLIANNMKNMIIVRFSMSVGGFPKGFRSFANCAPEGSAIAIIPNNRPAVPTRISKLPINIFNNLIII